VDETTYWADENFVGAKLQIITRRGKIHDIRTLSGGQRTTLSLAFILALQQNTPARFFLFDEIDQVMSLINPIKKHMRRSWLTVISIYKIGD